MAPLLPANGKPGVLLGTPAPAGSIGTPVTPVGAPPTMTAPPNTAGTNGQTGVLPTQASKMTAPSGPGIGWNQNLGKLPGGNINVNTMTPPPTTPPPGGGPSGNLGSLPGGDFSGLIDSNPRQTASGGATSIGLPTGGHHSVDRYPGNTPEAHG